MPLITSVPFFINAPQFDMFEVMFDTDNFEPVSPSQLSFVEEFQAGTLALIAALPSSAGVFSPTCLVHCLSGDAPFSQLAGAGTTLAASLASWYFEGAHVSAVSSCVGWQCTQQCGVDLQNGMPCNMGTKGCSPITVMVADAGATTSTDTQGEDGSDVAQQMARLQQAGDATSRRMLRAAERCCGAGKR
jgi:hypothetical protein